MKKVLLGIVFFFGVLAAQAQIKSGSLSTQLGVKLGYNSNSFKIENISISGGNFSGGVFMVKPFSEKLGLQAELLFDRKTYDDGGATSYFNYLSVPVLAKGTFGAVGVYAGPNIGLFLSAGDSENGKYSSEDLSGIKKLPLGFNLGANYTFGKFVGDVRYQAFGKLSESTDDSEEVKISTIQISIGYILK